jgi:hypothetical protein
MDGPETLLLGVFVVVACLAESVVIEWLLLI